MQEKELLRKLGEETIYSAKGHFKACDLRRQLVTYTIWGCAFLNVVGIIGVHPLADKILSAVGLFGTIALLLWNEGEGKNYRAKHKEAAEKYLALHKEIRTCYFLSDRNKAKRETATDFPMEVLREVVANAIIHRDYSITEATNYIYIGPEKIIVRSPGMPMPPLTIDDIRTMDLPSVSRNPKIMYVYNRMGMAEQRGIGLRNMKRLPQYGFPLPTFNMKGNILEIVFARDASLIPELKGANTEGLTQEDRDGLFFIQQNEPVAVKDYAKHFGLTDKTAQRRIARLFERGLLEKEGDNRWIKYRIKK